MQSFCQSSINFRISHRFVKSMSTPRNVKITFVGITVRHVLLLRFGVDGVFLCDVDDDDEMREKPLN